MSKQRAGDEFVIEGRKDRTFSGAVAFALLALLAWLPLGCASAMRVPAPVAQPTNETRLTGPTAAAPSTTTSAPSVSSAPTPAADLWPAPAAEVWPAPVRPAARRTTESWAQLVKEGRGHLQRDELPQAEDRFTRAYDRTHRFRPGDPRTATSLRNLERLATAYLKASNSPSFERTMGLLVVAASEGPAGRTRELASLLQQLAVAQMRDERAAEAHETLELTLEVLTEATGPQDSAFVGLHAQLAESLIALGELDQAEAHVDQAAEIGLAVGGPDGMLVAMSLLARSKLDFARGDVEGARKALQTSVNLHEQKYGENHRATAAIVRELAMFEQRAGDDAAAERSFDRVIEIWDSMPNEAYQQAQSRNELAWLLVESGQPKQAEAPARSAFDMLQDWGISGPPWAAIADTLATSLRDQGKYKESESLYQQALAAGSESNRLPDSNLAEIAERYAVLLDETGRSQAAADIRSRWRETKLGDDPLGQDPIARD